MDSPVELYVATGCPHCEAAREDLEWRGVPYAEYDVEADPDARARLLQLAGGSAIVPVIGEPGKAPQFGWQGRGCPVR